MCKYSERLWNVQHKNFFAANCFILEIGFHGFLLSSIKIWLFFFFNAYQIFAHPHRMSFDGSGAVDHKMCDHDLAPRIIQASDVALRLGGAPERRAFRFAGAI